jgi:hypothetical protein
VAKSLNEGAMLWHQKFSHLNMASLKKLDKMVNGMNLKEVVNPIFQYVHNN